MAVPVQKGKQSLNDRLVVEVYKKGELQSKKENGFAMISQKVSLKGLKILMDCRLKDGTFIKKGDLAYIKEESLHTQAWAQKNFECDVIEGPFLIIDINQVEFVAESEGNVFWPI